jgi:chromosome segregation ATPase
VKTEELNRTQRCLETQNQEFSQTKQHISMISSKEESYSKRLQERDNEVANLKHRLRQATAELEDLHKNEAMRNMDND